MTGNSHPYSYQLPPERIAQRPVYPYDAAKLLVVDGVGIADRTFSDLDQLLSPGDLLILNDTVVRPVRFVGVLADEGRSASVEIFLIGQRGVDEFEALGKPMRKLSRLGTVVRIDDGLSFTVLERLGEKNLLVRANIAGQSVTNQFDRSQLDKSGLMPIPPYIRQGISDAQDRTDYQTRFARDNRVKHEALQFGSVAAPTASLHFTEPLLARLDALGVQRAYVTLDVGTASLLSVVQEDGTVRPPSPEQMYVPAETIELIARTRAAGGRVIAVGTTVVRALEAYARDGATAQHADIFIKPGHRFSMFDGLITNFHQPDSSHLMLMEAYLGREGLERCYRHALAHDYRFLSYGDAMLVLPERPKSGQ